jgi:hypothetical protein
LVLSGALVSDPQIFFNSKHTAIWPTVPKDKNDADLFCDAVRRVKIIGRRNPHETPFIRWLVICIYIVGILFISSSSILLYGFGLNLNHQCKGAIILCLVFYLSGKILMYMFLVERARLLCLPLKHRKHDVLWIVNMAMVCVGFGIVAILSFVYLVSKVSPDDGQCRIGLQAGAAGALLAYDTFINVWLTGLFIKLAAKYMKNFFPEPISRQWRRLRHRPSIQRIQLSAGNKQDDASDAPISGATDASGDLARLARKTVMGSTIMMTSTIINMAVLLRFHGEEAGWVCLLICTTDREYTSVMTCECC